MNASLLLCTTCEKFLPRSSFCNRVANKNRGQKAHVCKACKNTKRMLLREKPEVKQKEKDQTTARHAKYEGLSRPTYVVCSMCQELLVLSEENFYKCKTSKVGFRDKCKTCLAESIRELRLRRRYGITYAEYKLIRLWVRCGKTPRFFEEPFNI